MSHKRSQAAEQAREIVAMIAAGQYTSPTSRVVSVSALIDSARSLTKTYPPGEPCPGFAPGSVETRVEVTGESTLAAARRLVGEGCNVVALNFASARHPGGGFLSGARAQEESLCRSSGLFACLEGHAMYAYHSERSDPFYSDYVVYSPGVPVVRDDDGDWLEEPFLCSFITSPAVNAKVARERSPGCETRIREAMRVRIDKVLAVAAAHGHDAAVLGAWGCGVFGNDCREIAELFADALATTYRGCFASVVFAVLDTSPERRYIGPFEQLFGTES